MCMLYIYNIVKGVHWYLCFWYLESVSNDQSAVRLCLRSEIQDALVAQEISLKTTKALKHGETWSHGTPVAVQLQEIVDSCISRHTHTQRHIWMRYEIWLNDIGWSPMNSAFILHRSKAEINGGSMAWPFLAILPAATMSMTFMGDHYGAGNIKQIIGECRPHHSWKRAQEGNSSTLELWSSHSSCSPGCMPQISKRGRRLKGSMNQSERVDPNLPFCVTFPRQRKDHIERLVWRYVTLQGHRRRQVLNGGNHYEHPQDPP